MADGASFAYVRKCVFSKSNKIRFIGPYVCSAAVTASAAEGVRGLLLQGRRKSTNLVVGQFVVQSRAATTVDCDGPDDTLVAWYGTRTGASDAGFSSKSFTWIPPDDGAEGRLEFVYVTLRFIRFV